jgi:hypothetical protein
MMSDQDQAPEQAGMPRESSDPAEEELRAAYEAQIKKLRVEHLVIENVVTLANLGMRRTGLAPGTEDERDAEQVRIAIESIRALLPLVEQIAPNQVGSIREAVSQLQLAFVRIGGQGAGAPAGGAAAGAPPEPERPPGPGSEPSPGPKPDEPGPAQRSGRLWVPGQ